MAKVLEELKGNENRKAYFITVMCLVDETGVNYFEGRVYGNLTKEIRGEKGFGYDPIFYYPPLKKTSAVMTMEEKNKVSHRAKALKALYDYLEEEHK